MKHILDFLNLLVVKGLTVVINILRYIIYILIYITSKLDTKKAMTILYTAYNDNGRYLLYSLSNNNLSNRKKVLYNIYTSLMSDERFRSFGNKKVIIVSGIVDGNEFNFHHNILISNNTTFEEYYNNVKNIINNLYDEGYQVDVIPSFKVMVWNMDEFSNRKIKITKDATTLNYNKISKRMFSSYIKPIKAQNINASTASFASMDIETISHNGIQIPIAISLAYSDNLSRIFLIDDILFNINPSKALDNLWLDFFDFITKNPKIFKTLFVHNLGSFDGLFLYKPLSNIYDIDKVSTIIDDKNKFIKISLKLDKDTIITWKDSYRIFPVSLDDLCKVFNVSGKTSKYDNRFNNINIFKNLDLLEVFKEYSLQDALALYKALDMAQTLYSTKYSVDITTVLSNSTLSLKIFRQTFLNENIPIMKGVDDDFIRKAYYGGATDYYKAYATDLNYYDVNSLYPNAMLKDIPHEIINKYNDMSNVKLEDFFGFCLAEVTTPKFIKMPLLPYKYKGRTIFPTGTWIGVYYSEDLKGMKSLGYKIPLIRGIEFSRIDLFSSYVEHFFILKKCSTGAERWIAKMHLNGLYGIFGRKQDLIETININNKDLPIYASTRVIKNIIKINDKISTVLLLNNINEALINDLNNVLESNYTSSYVEVKSNVAIAAAVTSYARIHMIPYKLLPGCVYTDTDSIFTTSKLPDHLLGTEIGEMKDELSGITINEAYFLGIKNMDIGT
jgi:hypothetical protein